ncbi:MAG: DUF692 domain-containing protein [Polyangiales bacterium]
MDSTKKIGLGLRHDLAEQFLAERPSSVDFIEIHPENFMKRGGRFGSFLERAREHYPIATHGLTMCFGSPDPFDNAYLVQLRTFLDDLQAPWHSDHLCFAGMNGTFLHDLLPLPFNDESLQLVSERVEQAQNALGRPLAVENVSYYAPQTDHPLDEVDFIVALLSRTGAKLLLDVNNVYVNSKNFDFDPRAFVDRVRPDDVVQMHIAGHLIEDKNLRIDTPWRADLRRCVRTIRLYASQDRAKTRLARTR